MPDFSFTSAGGGSASDPMLAYYQGPGSNSPLNPFAIRPINGPYGITGYAGFGQGTGTATQWPYANPQNTFAPVSGNSRYSALYGGQNSPVYNPTTNSYDPQSGGAPVWNGSGWVTASGQPFTGTYGGQTFNLGQSYQQMANDPNSRYRSVGIVKNPGVASATDALTAGFQPTAGITDFSDLLNSARTATGAATAGFASDQNAYDIQPLSDTLNRLNAGYAGTTAGLNSRYSDILGRQAGNENSILNQANANLGQYDKAVTDVGNLAQNALQQQVSRYKLGTGTPMSLGGGEEAMLINGTNAIQVPLALDKINAQQNLLLGTALPLAQGQAQRQIGQLTGFTAPLAQQNYQNQYNTSTLVKNLQLQTAGMAINDAANYLRTMAIPDQTIMQVLQGNQGLKAGDISNLGGLNNLYSGSRYQGLQDLFGAYPSQPSVSTFSPPGGASAYPGGSRYAGYTGTNGYQPMFQNGQQQEPAYQAGQPYQVGNSNLTATGNGYFTDGSGNYWNANGQIVYTNPNVAPAAAPTNPIGDWMAQNPETLGKIANFAAQMI